MTFKDIFCINVIFCIKNLIDPFMTFIFISLKILIIFDARQPVDF